MPTFYTNLLIPSRFSGYTIGPVILIRPSSKNDLGLLEHEKVHKKQWLRTFGLFSLLYLFSDNYKLKSEAEAYAKQLSVTGVNRLDLFAHFIATKYGLDVTKEQAKEAIVEFLDEPTKALLNKAKAYPTIALKIQG